MTTRRLWLALGIEGIATALLCGGLLVAAPRVFRRQRRRYGCIV